MQKFAMLKYRWTFLFVKKKNIQLFKDESKMFVNLVE